MFVQVKLPGRSDLRFGSYCEHFTPPGRGAFSLVNSTKFHSYGVSNPSRWNNISPLRVINPSRW